jgi:serine/threonine-protein kinase RsbW
MNQGPSTTDTIELRFRHVAEPTAIRRARHEVEDALASRVTARVLGDVMLLVSELVTNAVRHAATDEFEIAIEVAAGGLRIEVRDGGGGFVPVIAPSQDGNGGYGLYIVDRLADRWGVDCGEQGVIWLELGPGGQREG